MTKFLKNVEVFDTGGRSATTTFVECGLGDVLIITFESEVNNIRKQYGVQGFEMVVPEVNVLAAFPVVWVDKNVKANGTEKAVKAYLNWLYTPQAQTIITDYILPRESEARLLAGSDENPFRQRRRAEQNRLLAAERK